MLSTQPFGRTGHQSTRIIFGAAALSAVTQEEADRTMELVQEHGINHIDVAASYGEAEDRLERRLYPAESGKVMRPKWSARISIVVSSSPVRKCAFQ